MEIAVTSPGKLVSVMEVKKMKDEEIGLTLASKLEKVTIGFDADGDAITSLVAVAGEVPANEKGGKKKLKANEQTMYSMLYAAKRLDTSDWNEQARNAGIG